MNTHKINCLIQASHAAGLTAYGPNYRRNIAEKVGWVTRLRERGFADESNAIQCEAETLAACLNKECETALDLLLGEMG